MIIEHTKDGDMPLKNFVAISFGDMIKPLPPANKQEYDTETRQLTIYCTDGTVYRLQMVQIN